MYKWSIKHGINGGYHVNGYKSGAEALFALGRLAARFTQELGETVAVYGLPTDINSLKKGGGVILYRQSGDYLLDAVAVLRYDG